MARGKLHGSVNAMAVLPDHEVWTVGQDSLIAHSYLQYGDEQTKEYYLEGGGGYISSVDFVSPDDGWITAFDGQIDHWNGKTWENIVPPDYVSDIVVLDIKFVNKSDGYVVGCNQNISDEKLSKPIVMHWNGSNWENILSSNSIGEDGFCLHQIAVLSDKDIWVAGGRYMKGIVLHWDGTNWQEIEFFRTCGCGCREFHQCNK